jgi:radical SAM superfamily enzyme YgiQ (UPF0313 family)
MKIKKILLIQPFSLTDKQLSDILLAWPVYLENFLKAHFEHLKFDILYLPAEQKQKQLTIDSFEDQQIKHFFSQMNMLIEKLEFNIDQSTLILISCPFSHFYLPTKIIADYFNLIYKKTPIVVGGAHISACPSDFIDYSPIDYLVPGEGEIPLLNLIRSNPKKNKSPILLKKKYIEDLNKLPMIDFTSLSIEKYMSNFSGLAIYLSRGCPYNCRFCMEQNLIEGFSNLKKWRSYSPSRAVEEVNNMVSFGKDHDILNYGFLDPIFGFNQKWLNSFLEKYTEYNSSSFWLETRLDILNEKILKKFQKINFYPWYGLEHTSYKMLKKMNKTNNPKRFINKFQDILAIHKQLDFVCQVNILLLHPGETKQTLTQAFQDLEDMILIDGFDKILLSIRRFHNYPGTFIFKNSELLHKKYGMEMYPIATRWWQSKDLNVQKNGEYCVRPSKELTLREGVEIWTELYKQFNKKQFLKNKSQTKEKSSSIHLALLLKERNRFLEETKNEFMEFLNFHHIEV